MEVYVPPVPITLAELQTLEQKRHEAESQNVGVTFMKDIKNSLLFQYDWAELLTAAPVAISLMGACYMAASNCTHTIDFGDAKPEKGFQYLKYPTLKASLVQVSDGGQMAFIEAEKNMGKISMTSASLAQTVNKILQCINNLPEQGAALALSSNLEMLKSGSANCYSYAQAAEKAFDDWLNLIQELHQVSVYKQELSVKQKEQDLREREAKEMISKLTKTDTEKAKAAAKALKFTMNEVKTAFLKASMKSSGPWDILALSLAGSFAQTATTAFCQTIPVMMNDTHPNGSTRSHERGQTYHGGHPSGASMIGRRSYESFNTRGMPEDYDDAAYAWALTISPHTAQLYSLLSSGADGGVDWSVEAMGGVGALLTAFQYYDDSLKFTQTNPSRILKKAIQDSLKILREVETVCRKISTLSFTAPTASSPEVKGWHEKIKIIQASVLQLKASALTMPGNSPGPPPGLPMISSNQPLLIDPKTQRVALAQATERLKITEAAYSNAQKNYSEKTRELCHMKEKLLNIRVELKRLSQTSATLEDVKGILLECISVLINLKDQVSKLVRFFGAISSLVEHVLNTSVQSFMHDAKNSETFMMKLGEITLCDFLRSNIFSSSLTVRAYFVVIKSIADIYKKVSREYIFPGLEICGEQSRAVSANEPRKSMLARNKKLDDYSITVESELHNMITQAQITTIQDLDKRVQAIAETTTRLNVSFPGAAEAIKAGAAASVINNESIQQPDQPPIELENTSFDYKDGDI